MYTKLVVATCILAFFAVVLSAYARLSDAGIGCVNWPACYKENALKDRQIPAGAARAHSSWQWKLHSQVVQLLGILAIAVCGISWKKRKDLRQSPLLPTLLLGVMVFLAVFGILAFDHLPRPIIVTVHLAGGIAMLALLVWIVLGQMVQAGTINVADEKKLRAYSWVGIALLLVQAMQGGWVSANFAALACTDFPLCKGAFLPPMDLSFSLNNSMAPHSVENLTAIHWIHRIGALFAVIYLTWLSVRIMALDGLRNIGRILLALAVLQSVVGISNVMTGLPLAGAVMHNALAMLLLAALVMLAYRLQNHGMAKP